MKKLENFELTLTLEKYFQEPTGTLKLISVTKNLMAFEHIKNILSLPPAEGWKEGINLDKLESRLQIKGLLTEAINSNKDLILEDAQHKELLECNKGFGWNVGDEQVLKFSNWIKSPQEYKL
jgi:hypothetical protein